MCWDFFPKHCSYIWTATDGAAGIFSYHLMLWPHQRDDKSWFEPTVELHQTSYFEGWMLYRLSYNTAAWILSDDSLGSLATRSPCWCLPRCRQHRSRHFGDESLDQADQRQHGRPLQAGQPPLPARRGWPQLERDPGVPTTGSGAQSRELDKYKIVRMLLYPGILADMFWSPYRNLEPDRDYLMVAIASPWWDPPLRWNPVFFQIYSLSGVSESWSKLKIDFLLVWSAIRRHRPLG